MAAMSQSKYSIGSYDPWKNPNYVASEFKSFKAPEWVNFGQDHLGIFNCIQDQSVNINSLECGPYFSHLKALINLWLKVRFWWNYFYIKLCWGKLLCNVVAWMLNYAWYCSCNLSIMPVVFFVPGRWHGIWTTHQVSWVKVSWLVWLNMLMA